MKKLQIFVLLMESIIFASAAFAQQNDQKIYYNSPKPLYSLSPKTKYVSDYLDNCNANSVPLYVQENIYYLNKKDLNSDVSKITISNISKSLRSISRMEGMQYFRSGDQEWATLYKDAYCIKGPKNRTKVMDNVSGNADGLVQYCMLNDNKLGKINYRLDYRQCADEVCVKFTNTSACWIGPVKAMDEGRQDIFLDVTDLGDSLRVYIVIRADYTRMDALEFRIRGLFPGRLEALYTWFCRECGSYLQ